MIYILLGLILINGLINTFLFIWIRRIMADDKKDFDDRLDKLDSVTTKLGTDIKTTVGNLVKKANAGQDFSAEKARLDKLGDALISLDGDVIANDPGDGSTIVPPPAPGDGSQPVSTGG